MQIEKPLENPLWPLNVFLRLLRVLHSLTWYDSWNKIQEITLQTPAVSIVWKDIFVLLKLLEIWINRQF